MYSRFFHVANSVHEVEVVNPTNDEGLKELAKKYDLAQKDRMHQIR